MLVDIFSSFDDSNQVFMSFYMLNWVMSLFFLTLINHSYWVVQNEWKPYIVGLQTVGSVQSLRGNARNFGGTINAMAALFVFLVLMNLSGLVPYVFSTTSHLGVSLTLGFPLWLIVIISSVQLNPKAFSASLLPMGAPAPLNPFLVIIETVSIAVRPLTLSVRLMANMSAGHIVLTIVGSYLTVALFSIPGSMSFLFLGGLQILYTIFEFVIAIIQGYIFCLLITLYFDDHSPKVLNY